MAKTFEEKKEFIDEQMKMWITMRGLSTAKKNEIWGIVKESLSLQKENIIKGLEKKYEDGSDECLVVLQPHNDGTTQRPALAEVIELINKL